jgi:hypothetical protein
VDRIGSTAIEPAIIGENGIKEKLLQNFILLNMVIKVFTPPPGVAETPIRVWRPHF